MPLLAVTRTYLEMRSPGDLVPAREPAPGARIERVGGCPISFFRYLYTEVGRSYHWTDRLGWTDAEIAEYLGSGSVTLHVLYLEHAPAGYYELRGHQDGSVEIAYFGLLPEYTGRGLGGSPGPQEMPGSGEQPGSGSTPAPSTIRQRYPTTGSAGSCPTEPRSTRPNGKRFESLPRALHPASSVRAVTPARLTGNAAERRVPG
jgi:GNAT superfamily N-acetyltransferase